MQEIKDNTLPEGWKAKNGLKHIIITETSVFGSLALENPPDQPKQNNTLSKPRRRRFSKKTIHPSGRGSRNFTLTTLWKLLNEQSEKRNESPVLTDILC